VLRAISLSSIPPTGRSRSETLELKKTRIKERLENLAVEIAKLASH
jgi:hypothetical protein